MESEEQFLEIIEQEYQRDYHDPNGYKIRCGYYYPVYRTEVQGHIFYKIPVGKKLPSGERITKYKNVSFRNKLKDCNIPNNAIIKPLRMYEDFYMKPNDEYNPVFTLVITDWEVKETVDKIKRDALAEYKKTISIKDLDFNDEDLPF